MSKRVRTKGSGFVEYIKSEDEMQNIELSRKVKNLEKTVESLLKIIEEGKGKEERNEE